MRPIHGEAAGRLLLVAALAGPLAGAAACSGSAGAAAPPPTPTSTRPAHDLRQIPELEQVVTDEFNAGYADPVDAKYAPGVTVKKVVCVQEAGTAKYDCLVTPSKGQARSWAYLVAQDGGSLEHAENGG